MEGESKGFFGRIKGMFGGGKKESSMSPPVAQSEATMTPSSTPESANPPVAPPSPEAPKTV